LTKLYTKIPLVLTSTSINQCRFHCRVLGVTCAQ